MSPSNAQHSGLGASAKNKLETKASPARQYNTYSILSGAYVAIREYGEWT